MFIFEYTVKQTPPRAWIIFVCLPARLLRWWISRSERHQTLLNLRLSPRAKGLQRTSNDTWESICYYSHADPLSEIKALWLHQRLFTHTHKHKTTPTPIDTFVTTMPACTIKRAKDARNFVYVTLFVTVCGENSLAFKSFDTCTPTYSNTHKPITHIPFFSPQ